MHPVTSPLSDPAMLEPAQVHPAMQPVMTPATTAEHTFLIQSFCLASRWPKDHPTMIPSMTSRHLINIRDRMQCVNDHYLSNKNIHSFQIGNHACKLNKCDVHSSNKLPLVTTRQHVKNNNFETTTQTCSDEDASQDDKKMAHVQTLA